MPYNTEEIRHAYKSKYNKVQKNHFYLAVKKLSALFIGKTWKHKGDFYHLNCFHLYSMENKLKNHYNICKNHDNCYVEMPNKSYKILKYNYGEKSMRVLFFIYADLESLLEKMSACHNNPEKSSTVKINRHTPSGYSLFSLCSLI